MERYVQHENPEPMHCSQDADCCTSQVSFDREKAFDQVEHHFIIQAFGAFGVPEIMIIMAIQYYTLVGFACVEVNGRKGLLITIKTGGAQGDPLSRIFSIIATEPLNCILTTAFMELI
jgi:hypothetical protein